MIAEPLIKDVLAESPLCRFSFFLHGNSSSVSMVICVEPELRISKDSFNTYFAGCISSRTDVRLPSSFGMRLAVMKAKADSTVL